VDDHARAMGRPEQEAWGWEMNDFQDDFTRIRNRPDQWQPEIQHRQLERRLVGTYLFGLIKRYEYYYTDWRTE
jgi:hypothetical protein